MGERRPGGPRSVGDEPTPDVPIYVNAPEYKKPSVINNVPKHERQAAEAAAKEAEEKANRENFVPFSEESGNDRNNAQEFDIAKIKVEAERQARLEEVRKTFANRPSAEDRIKKINDAAAAEKAAAAAQLQESMNKDAKPKGFWNKAKKLFRR